MPVEDVFARLHIDILCSFPKTKQGFQYVLLVVDSFSKWIEAFPLRTQEAKEIADILYNEIFTRYGAPRTIVSDRGRNFMSKLVNAICELFEVKWLHTSSYHPQTNATVERANGTLAQTLRAYIDELAFAPPQYHDGFQVDSMYRKYWIQPIPAVVWQGNALTH